MRQNETYPEMFVRVNGDILPGFRNWRFRSGMLFGAGAQWWGRGGERPRSHEGVDFCLYEDTTGTCCPLPPGLLVPAFRDGVVVVVHPDFLGQTIWVRHHETDSSDYYLCSAYGHVHPVPALVKGAAVVAGAVIATVADRQGRRKAVVPPHLHLSVARIRGAVDPACLNWSLAADPEVVQLLDPLTFL